MRLFICYSLCVISIVGSGLVSPVPSIHVATAASSIEYVPLAPIDVNGSEFKTGVRCVAPDCFPKYLRTIYNVGVAIAGLFAVFSIVNGGFTLLFTDSILGHSEGKGKILRALGGLVIVYSSYIFMNQISPSLGRDLDLSLSFPRITIRKDTATLQVISADQLILESAELASKARGLYNEKQQLTKDADDLKKAEEEAAKISDPAEKARVLAGLGEDRKRLEEAQRLAAAKEIETTAKNRILNDLNASLGLPTLRGEYAKRSMFVATNGRQFGNEIAQAEKALNDGVLEQYVTEQVNKLQPLITAATSQEEKQKLRAFETETRNLVTEKQNAIKRAIKAECDKWRAGNFVVRTETPPACDRYK